MASLTTDGAQVLRLEMQPKWWRADALAVASNGREMIVEQKWSMAGGLYGGGAAAKTADRTLMQGSPRGEPRTAKEHTRYALDVTKYIDTMALGLIMYPGYSTRSNGLVNFHTIGDRIQSSSSISASQG